VRRSKNAALVGVSGIVVQETENTFKVVTRKNKPKGACACMYVCMYAELPDLILVQCYQSRGPSSRSPSLCIVQNLPAVAAAGVNARPTHNARRPCWMALTSKSSCMVTSSVFGPRIERGGSSSTRRPSSSDMRWARARLSFSFCLFGVRAFLCYCICAHTSLFDLCRF